MNPIIPAFDPADIDEALAIAVARAPLEQRELRCSTIRRSGRSWSTRC